MDRERFKLELFFRSLWKAADSSSKLGQIKSKAEATFLAFAPGEKRQSGLPHRSKVDYVGCIISLGLQSPYSLLVALLGCLKSHIFLDLKHQRFPWRY